MDVQDPWIPTICALQKVRRETHDCFSMQLDPPCDVYRYKPGQFNMLYVAGVGEVPISISSSPEEPLTHTIRAVGAVTKALKALKPGQQIGIRGPFGSSWPVEQAQGRDILILTGGIGLSPLRPAILYMLKHRSQFGRIEILFGTRTPRDILHASDLRKWAGRLDLSVHVTVDYATEPWKGNVGVVTNLIPRVQLKAENTMALLCGPEIMMRYGLRSLETLGIPAGQIYLSMERNMKCAVGYCGHCQYGPHFICKEGPVFALPQIAELLTVAGI